MQKIIDAPGFFKQMSAEEFLKLGMRDIAYIRTIEGEKDSDEEQGTVMYSIHAADGTTLSVKDSLDMALTTVMKSDLAPITIH